MRVQFVIPVLVSILILGTIAANPLAFAQPNTVIASIPVGSFPFGIAVNELTDRAYVMNGGSNTVSIIDTTANTVTATIPAGGPRGTAVNELTDRAYATGSNTLSVINTLNDANTVIATIPVGPNSNGIAVNELTDRAYVANTGSNSVSVINTLNDANTVIATILAGSGPLGITVNELTDRAYVTNQFSNTVSVIDTTTNTVTATISVGSFPQGITVNELTDRAYVVNLFSNTVSVIDTLNDANTVIATIPVGSNPLNIAVNELTDRAYVTNFSSNTVSVINTLNDANTVIASIHVGTNPRGIAVNELTERAYVVNFRSNSVSVIEIESINAPPDAVDDSAETLANISVDVQVLDNDTDLDGDVLTVISRTDGTNGVTTTDGTTVTYMPNPNYDGPDSFTYTISDGRGASDTATVTITVLSATEGLQNLLDLINTIGTPTGIETSLAAPLGNASDLLNDMNTNNDAAVCSKLDAFINEVNAQEGINNLSPEDADLLRGLAEDIKTSIGC